ALLSVPARTHKLPPLRARTRPWATAPFYAYVTSRGNRISGNIRLAPTEPTQLLIDPSSVEGKPSGLAYPSAVKCENLFTMSQQDIIRTLGSLPASLMARIDDCLKAALGLP